MARVGQRSRWVGGVKGGAQPDRQVRGDSGHSLLTGYMTTKMEEIVKSRGSPLRRREKDLICNVYDYFLEGKTNRGPIIDPSKTNERTAKATKISTKTVSGCALNSTGLP